MKSTRLISLLALGFVLAVVGPGCRTHHPAVTPLPGRPTTGSTNPNLPPAGTFTPGGLGSEALSSTPTGIPSNPPGSHDGWTEHPDVLQTDTVYFDYDSSTVKSSEQPKVAAVADYLKANPSDAVRIEGNCDERGTEEYNRALGERRALAVREELVRLGIEPSRIDTISYGEDRPKDPGHNETAWSLNRRDDFVVLTPP